ncbi:hypothetical protein WS96_30330 [Burkholderia sp. MSMB1835]|nr:hypothetical protein WS96_30330 [Burkholderia sp. MSMB1835]
MHPRGARVHARAYSDAATNDACVRATRIAAPSHREPVPLTGAAAAGAHCAAHALMRPRCQN